MESVYKALGAPLANVLKENDIDTVDIFMALNQSKVMGKPETGGLNQKLGVWMKIEAVQQTCLQSGSHSTQVSSNPEDPCENICKEEVIRFVTKTPGLQRILYRKLNPKIPLTTAEIKNLNKYICGHFFGMLNVKGITIPLESKKKLALAIVDAWECLATTMPGRPRESEWFWEHGGEPSGQHTGRIQNWIRNDRFKSGPKKSRRCTVPVSAEMSEAIAKLEEESDDEDESHLLELMQTTFEARNTIRTATKSSLFDVHGFRFLLRFPGHLILREYQMMFPESVCSYPEYAQSCAMLCDFYDEIKCYDIQVLMRIKKKLGTQGRSCKSIDSSLSPGEDFVAEVIRWQKDTSDSVQTFIDNAVIDHPYILCDAKPFELGTYYVIHNGWVITSTDEFYTAFDMLYKMYKVFTATIPAGLKSTFLFFDSLIYNICAFTKHEGVNRVVDTVRKSKNRSV